MKIKTKKKYKPKIRKIKEKIRKCIKCKEKYLIENFYKQHGYRINTCKKCYCDNLKISGNWVKIIRDLNIK
jgi:hypothetical protein